ncbi:MAG TPA: NepR family anti-sigma factor [Xanthobacteraceae bacterium]|jgi:hypothetical protein|nr:NepR family anti-sigma factor [Xanthobacteraceae bacterium]
MTTSDDKPGKPMQRTRDGEPATGGGLTREATIKIGQQLRAMYDEVVKEGVPDRFTDLLKRLDNQDRGGEGSRS